MALEEEDCGFQRDIHSELEWNEQALFMNRYTRARLKPSFKDQIRIVNFVFVSHDYIMVCDLLINRYPILFLFHSDPQQYETLQSTNRVFNKLAPFFLITKSDLHGKKMDHQVTRSFSSQIKKKRNGGSNASPNQKYSMERYRTKH